MYYIYYVAFLFGLDMLLAIMNAIQGNMFVAVFMFVCCLILAYVLKQRIRWHFEDTK